MSDLRINAHEEYLFQLSEHQVPVLIQAANLAEADPNTADIFSTSSNGYAEHQFLEPWKLYGIMFPAHLM